MREESRWGGGCSVSAERLLRERVWRSQGADVERERRRSGREGVVIVWGGMGWLDGGWVGDGLGGMVSYHVMLQVGGGTATMAGDTMRLERRAAI